MTRTVHYIRRQWKRSRAFRIILIVAAVYAVLRLAVHGAYLAMMLYPSSEVMGGMPEWTGAEGEPMIPVDLQIYLDAAQHFQDRQDLYLQGSLARLEEHYPYAPSFALAFVPFLALSPPSISWLHSLLHVAAYVLLYTSWAEIFEASGLDRANEALAMTTPLWLVFSAFWADLGYLNIYLIMALTATRYLKAILAEDLGRSVLWLSVILQVKPHWAFATAVPLVLGRWRYFFRLIILALLGYLAIVGVVAAVGGPKYAFNQYAEYVSFLGRLSRDFPWRGPDAAFLGYNHSIKQLVFYLAGRTPGTALAVMMTKVVLLTPLGIAACRLLLRRPAVPLSSTPSLTLDLAFALYLGAFIWLDMVWELSLGIAIFAYLLGTVNRVKAKSVLWIVFTPYALVDVWQLVSLAAFGMSVVAPGPYVLTDPSIYVPVVMIVIVSFYAIAVKRLWSATSRCPVNVKAQL